MNIRITNLCNGTVVTLTDVKTIQADKCELSIVFNENHSYESIDEIIETLSQVMKIGSYNYHFKGEDIYGNHFSDMTDLLLMIGNEDLRYYIY